MIPTESNHAEWFACSARYYLMREGYAFLTFALEQVAEPGFPVARLVAEGSRLVGLRFLRPVEAAPGARVCAYQAGRSIIEADAGWTLYALPQSSDPLDQQLTHQKILFARADEMKLEGDELVPAAGVNFKQLIAGIEDGTFGREVQTEWSAGDLVCAAGEHQATLYLVVNGRSRIVFALWGASER